MDHVAEATHYEPLMVRTCPQGTHGRVLVHYSATTICPLPVHFSSRLLSDKFQAFGMFGVPTLLGVRTADGGLALSVVLPYYLSMFGEGGEGGDFCRVLLP